MTEQDEAAKNWAIVEKAKTLAAKVTRLEDELRSFTLSWESFGRKCQDSSLFYRITPEKIEALNIDVRETRDFDDPQFRSVLEAPAEHFDASRIKVLLTDLSDSRLEFRKIKRSLEKIGVALPSSF